LVLAVQAEVMTLKEVVQESIQYLQTSLQQVVVVVVVAALSETAIVAVLVVVVETQV
jgi:hypothetical protein